MSIEEQNVATVRTLYQAWSDGTAAQVAPRFVAPDFVRHDLSGAWPQVVGHEGLADFARMFSAALAGYHSEIVDIIASGDRVWVRYIGSGIHSGPLLGIPATGKRIEWNGINIYRLVDGKVVETWQLGDLLGILQQMGAVSIKGQPAQP